MTESPPRLCFVLPFSALWCGLHTWHFRTGLVIFFLSSFTFTYHVNQVLYCLLTLTITPSITFQNLIRCFMVYNLHSRTSWKSVHNFLFLPRQGCEALQSPISISGHIFMSVCPSGHIFVKPVSKFHENIMYMLYMRPCLKSSCDNSAMLCISNLIYKLIVLSRECYVLPILWMTSFFT